MEATTILPTFAFQLQSVMRGVMKSNNGVPLSNNSQFYKRRIDDHKTLSWSFQRRSDADAKGASRAKTAAGVKPVTLPGLQNHTFNLAFTV